MVVDMEDEVLGGSTVRGSVPEEASRGVLECVVECFFFFSFLDVVDRFTRAVEALVLVVDVLQMDLERFAEGPESVVGGDTTTGEESCSASRAWRVVVSCGFPSSSACVVVMVSGATRGSGVEEGGGDGSGVGGEELARSVGCRSCGAVGGWWRSSSGTGGDVPAAPLSPTGLEASPVVVVMVELCLRILDLE